ncbi:hypothetical protein KP509_02G023200 [Ceratopteris richardii]|uniref:Retrovirus-related Pol polyprotein from transposon TNT 1-94-like beta-barrel domain-containing protein n=1 Tax=Ceratopteris richardii TaxID=49495 RepID=A0A8T2V7W6_CERRI|nr:hypothetical protein KP509_02G023200 [Ceratopteris richardii]
MHIDTHKRKVNNKTWYVDSGCSNHMSHNMNMFVNLHKLDSRVRGTTTDSSEHEVVHIGDSPLNEHVTLRDFLFVPTIRRDLISIGQMEDNGVKVDFDNNQWQAYQENNGAFFNKRMKAFYFRNRSAPYISQSCQPDLEDFETQSLPMIHILRSLELNVTNIALQLVETLLLLTQVKVEKMSGYA